jgi:hypothetical protein
LTTRAAAPGSSFESQNQRTLQFRANRFESCAGERLAGQRVFDDTHEHAGGARLRAKVGHLRHREATVFGSDHRKGGLRHFGYFGNQHFLVFEIEWHIHALLDKSHITHRNTVFQTAPGTNR